MKDIISSSITLALSVFIYVASESFNIIEGGLTANPAYYPRIVASIMGVLSVIVLVQAFLKKPEFKVTFNKELIVNVSIVMAVLICYTIFLDILGFILATLIYVFAGISLFGGKVKTALIYFIPITIGVYIVFSILFGMPLPSGMLFG